MGEYSKAAIFFSETLATCTAIYLGEAIIANEVLAATKGRAMGWGFVALGFGLAFGIGILCFGYISAHMNPAFALALLILGKIDGGTFGVTIAGEFLGAFVGAILVWLHFLPHFKTVPAPPSLTPDDSLLKSNDALTASALGIASFNPHEEDIAARQRGIRDLTNVMEDIKYYLKDTYKATHPLDKHSELMEVALGPEALKGTTNLRRHSVQVCDVHRRLKDMELQNYENMLLNSSRYPPNRLYSNGTVAGQTADASNTHRSDLGNDVVQNDSRLQQRREHLDRLYDAALVADQNAKLSIFATRPATYSPAFNFLCELLSTLALTYGALMISERGGQLYGPERMTFEATEGFIIGFFIFVLVLGLGGPTGLAANPARDFSPRLAHFVLPIPNKGPSEFYYAWIPFLAPLVGGCAGAGLYALTQLVNHSNVSGKQTFPAQ